MTTNDTFERRLGAWLEDDSARRVPDHLDQVLVRTVATRQRPAWSSLERWLPIMDTVTPGRATNVRPVLFLALLGALLMAVVGVALIGAGRSALTVSPGLAENGRIYVADGMTLRSYATDGSDPQTVVELAAPGAGVAVSPDGRTVAVAVQTTPARIEIVDLASGRSTPVPMPGDLQAGNQISWSPDSDEIVFPGFKESGAEHVVVAPVDGNVARALRVIDVGLGKWWPAFSPTGDTISFVAVDKVAGTGTIHLMAPDGSDLRTLDTPSLGSEPGAVTWSPDPSVRRLAFSAEDGAGLGVRLIDVTTGQVTDVGPGFWPTWSPDGSRLAYWIDGTVTGDTAAILAGAADLGRPMPSFTGTCQDRRDLAGRSFCGPATWSPDGVQLLGLDITGASVLSVKSDGSEPRMIIPLDTPSPLGEVVAAWQPIRP